MLWSSRRRGRGVWDLLERENKLEVSSVIHIIVVAVVVIIIIIVIVLVVKRIVV